MRNLKSRLRDIAKKPAAEAPAAPPPRDCLRMKETYSLEQPLCPEGMFPAILGVSPCALEGALYIDTETTGLSGGAGTTAFLIGVGRFEEEGFVVRQFFLRDYGEEIFALQALETLLREASCIVSFNGKSFDLPLLRSRFIMHRLAPPAEALPHIDLLHAARRIWKPRLQGLRLVDLEREILQIFREGDIPGHEIPQAYFDYLKNRIWPPMEVIIGHNRQDIAALPALLRALAAAWENPMDPLDAYSIGKAHHRARDYAGSLRYFRIANVPALRAQASVSLAEAYRRSGDIEAYLAANQDMAQRRIGGLYPLEALAKHYEHRDKTPERALQITDEALLRCNDPAQLERLLHRRRRLMRKLTKK